MALRRFYMIENTNGARRRAMTNFRLISDPAVAAYRSTQTAQEGNACLEDRHPADARRISAVFGRCYDAQRVT